MCKSRKGVCLLCLPYRVVVLVPKSSVKRGPPKHPPKCRSSHVTAGTRYGWSDVKFVEFESRFRTVRHLNKHLEIPSAVKTLGTAYQLTCKP